MPGVYQNLTGKFEGVDIPVYVPAYLPGDGPYGVAKFNVTKNSYDFAIIKWDKPGEPKLTDPIAQADGVVQVNTTRQPFSPYPTEQQLWDQPTGTVTIDGTETKTKARSFNNSMAVSWTNFTPSAMPNRTVPGWLGKSCKHCRKT